MNLLYEYQNGPVNVKLYDDGTKIREWDETIYGEYPPKVLHAESMDIKITNKCTGSYILPNGKLGNCPFCHEESGPTGIHGSIDYLIDLFDRSELHAGMEMAIGGGNALEHPDIIKLLEYCKSKGFVPSLTMKDVHLVDELQQSKDHLNGMNYPQFIKYAMENSLVYGLGISITNESLTNKTLTDAVAEFCHFSKNSVIHVIEGINDYNVFARNFSKFVCEHDIKPKLLILGWKDVGRTFKMSEQQKKIYWDRTKVWQDNIHSLISWLSYHNGCAVFDNNSFEHLNIKQLAADKVIHGDYMGDEGTQTFFIDLVSKQFTKASVCKDRFNINDWNLNEMFSYIYDNREQIS